MAGRLVTRNLSVAYDAPEGGMLPALGPLSVNIASGSFVTLVGPSGCGKSTFVRVLAGLQTPTQGQALLDDTVIAGPSRRVGLMFQDANLMPWRTVLDNIVLPLELAGVSKVEREAAAYGLLQPLGLEDFAQAYPGELSGGMAQRVAIGRVMIQQPDILLLDEPFGALDALTREHISFDLLSIWALKRQTVLMVTHDIRESVLLSDRVLVMGRRPGQIIQDVSVDLPRPRRVEDGYSEACNRLAQRVRAAIDQA